MTTRVSRVDVDPAPLPRWRLGLFENGTGAGQLPPKVISRLAGGIGYAPYDVGDTLAQCSFDPCDTFTVEQDDCPTEVQWNAWGISQTAGASTLNADYGTIEAVKARARAKLEAKTSYLGEYTFWTGAVGASTFAALGWPNIALTDTTSAGTNWTNLTPSDTEAGIVEAFGLINEYLSDTLHGLRGMIHVAPQVLPYLAFYGSAQRTGFTLETTLSDHIIVCGSGYQGTGPGNAAVPNNRSWIYATSMVRVGSSDLTEDTLVANYDRANNQANATAYRAVIAEWDLTAHAGLRVCLTDPGPTCATEGS